MLDQFRPVLLDIDADQAWDGLWYRYAIGVSPLRIAPTSPNAKPVCGWLGCL
ncbi:MAG: hypothetical protein M0Z43_08745 [Acidithiobacillus sp.]|nr:hypothetical protein [Acidithiobacillus sp.]